uniref:Toxin n=1 Tax=Globodera pallida TaxID=36090 RepID=A0A183CN39_GLOPA
TGDLLLFDAYRRWYFEGRAKNAPSEPFFIRRVSQYTPLFNPSDSGGDLQAGNYHRRSELFSLMRQVIDATLIALPSTKEPDAAVIEPRPVVPASSTKTPESITDGRLEALALKQVTVERLVEDAELLPIVREMNSTNWSGAAATVIESNRELWQEMERLSIGASFDLLLDRMSDEQRAVAEKLADAKGDETSRVLGEYASGVLNRILQNNFRIWLPLAHSLLDLNLDDPLYRQASIKRISIGLRMPVPAEGEGLTSVASHPEIIFTQAALQAVKYQDIPNLSRFADHALRAIKFRETEGATVDSFEFELKYLNAVAQRLSIASVLPHLQSRETSAWIRERSGYRAIEQVKTYYGQAAVHLKQCLGAHYPLAGEDDDQAVRYLRALSERASLHLFTATSFGLAATAHRDMLKPDAHYYLQMAYDDLRLCIDRDLKSPINDPLMDVVRDQFIPNIAGYEVISYLLSEEGGYQMRPWPVAARKKVLAFWKREQHSHPLLAAELYSFGLLQNLSVPPGRKPNKEDLRDNIGKLRLPLDQALYREICEQLIRPYL